MLTGTTYFIYKVNDGSADSNTATVTITVNAVNDAPITNDISISINENLSSMRIVNPAKWFTSDVDDENNIY